MSAGATSRRKGLRGEQEVARILHGYGFDPRGLEGRGDHLMRLSQIDLRFDPTPITLHIEVKRQERQRPNEWMAQAEREAPAGAIPVVVDRRSNGRWYARLALDDLAAIASR